MRKKTLLCWAIFLLLLIFFLYKHRVGIKERINVFAYYHIQNSQPKLYKNDVFSFMKAKENPKAGHQGITSDGDYIYVTYPEDEGNGIGVIQKYTYDGHLIKSYAKAPVGHSSNCCVVDDIMYIIKKKELSKLQTLVTFDTKREVFDSCKIEFPFKIILEVLCNRKDTLVMVAMNGSGHTFYDAKTSNREQPDSIFFFYVKDMKFLKTQTIPVRFDFDYFTSQGGCVTDSAFYILSSSYIKDKAQPKSYRHGMDCIITKIPYREMRPYVVRPPQYIIPKAEGAFFNEAMGNYIFTSTSDSVLFYINMF